MAVGAAAESGGGYGALTSGGGSSSGFSMEFFQGKDWAAVLAAADVDPKVAEDASKAIAEGRYGDAYATWDAIPKAKKRQVVRVLPREARLVMTSVDDLKLSGAEIDELVEAVTVSGDLEKVVAVYDKIPSATRRRIITRLPKEARIVAESFDGLPKKDKLEIGASLLPEEAAVSRAERLGVEVEPDTARAAAMDKLQSKAAPTTVVRSQIGSLGRWIAEGPLTLSVLSFLAGIFAIVAAVVGFFVDLGDLGFSQGRSLLFLAINVWIMIFGLLIAVSEARVTVCSSYLRRIVEEWLPLLRSTSGRAWFLFFVGTLALAQWNVNGSQLLNIISGIVLEVLAVAYTVVACLAARRLAEVREKLTGPEVEERFDEFDVDGSGALDSVEFADLCKELGTALSHAELEAALVTLDTDRDGTISKGEFLAWWRGDASGSVIQRAMEIVRGPGGGEDGSSGATAPRAATVAGEAATTTNPLADVDMEDAGAA